MIIFKDKAKQDRNQGSAFGAAACQRTVVFMFCKLKMAYRSSEVGKGRSYTSREEAGIFGLDISKDPRDSFPEAARYVVHSVRTEILKTMT